MISMNDSTKSSVVAKCSNIKHADAAGYSSEYYGMLDRLG